MATTSIIGTGHVGSALARVFARSGVASVIANTHGPESFADLATEVAPTVRAVSLAEASDNDIILLAIPFLATREFGRTKPDWTGQIVVDATNAFLLPNADAILAGRPSTALVAGSFPGAKVVKAFNQLPANVLQRVVPADIGKTVVFVSSDHEDASAQIAALAESANFAAVEVGPIHAGGLLIQARNALVLRHFVERPMF